MSEVPLWCCGYANARHFYDINIIKRHFNSYRGHSKLRTHTALGPYCRARLRGIGPSWGRCVSLISSNP
jgi:hypothetical protein